MGEVIGIGKKKDDSEEMSCLSGDARCIACGHEWVAVVPVGTMELECIECKTMLGMFVWPTAPKSEDV